VVLDFGVDVNKPNEYGDTPLMDLSGSVECLRLLIENKADVSQASADGMTGLHCACVRGNVECLRLLIENKADVNYTAKEDGDT
jgi:ankyrin repeat protein